MADKKKKDYGMNVDFNSYGLRPAGSYIDQLKHLNDMLDSISSESSKSRVTDLQKDMNEADEAAKKLLEEMNKQDALSPDSPKTKAEEEPERPNLDELLRELDDLVGLEKIKQNVRSLINLAKVRKLREEQGLPTPAMSLHLVFMGNPGTGKTTVARLIAQLYYAIGVLSKGQLVEVDRSQLVAGYVGQTAIKTDEAIKKAMGGVLFIDEAYSLTSQEGANDFGHEAIETVLKAMEDHRDDLVVIVAGYENLMEKFINSNPGLESRFNRYFVFEDYNGDELYEIFEMRCRKNKYTLNEDAEQFLREHFKALYETRDDNFGNGRTVRNIFENVVSVQSDRVALIENPTTDDLMTVLKEDVEKAVEM
ncbi:MAG: AAA family ATPase [Oscillospiraceae bacterium]|nr:AAA family ATPase [Oscillospiraceae bacterium]